MSAENFLQFIESYYGIYIGLHSGYSTGQSTSYPYGSTCDMTGVGLLPTSVLSGYLWKAFGAKAPFTLGQHPEKEFKTIALISTRWQMQGKRCSYAWFTFKIYSSSMFFHDLMTNTQSQTCPFPFCCKEWRSNHSFFFF